ncbi:MAG: hypothetical protein J6L58_04145 [Clostridia bacterium]|nr:hypothetical protein [Clostridia bacterium]
MDLPELNPYDYFDTLSYRYKITRQFPFVSAVTIGKSVMGREIAAFMLGHAEEYALFVGGIHGNSHFTSTFLYAFFKELSQAYNTDGVIEGLKVKKALGGRGLIVVPCLNPDGCEIAVSGKTALGNMRFSALRLARKDFSAFALNARGADIEKVFGTSPLQEPESTALVNLCKSINIRHLITFDKGENRLLLPELCNVPERSSRMAEIMLTVSKLRLDSENAAGLCHWFCKEYHRPAFKVLLSHGDDPLADYSAIRELMMLSAIM